MITLLPMTSASLTPSPRFAQVLATLQATAPIEGRPLPPAPSFFGTGPLTNKNLTGHPNYRRFQKCADSDPWHFMPPEAGEHISDLKIYLAFIVARMLGPTTPDKEDAMALSLYEMMQSRDGYGKYGKSTMSTVWAYKKKYGLVNSKGEIDSIVGKKTIRLIDIHLGYL
jgi:hypothetical protein